MKTLIDDDDFTNRLILQAFLQQYGGVHIAVNGVEAVEATHAAIDKNDNYNLICLDIMMPEMDGHTALTCIRKLEQEHGILLGSGATVIMTTALSDPGNLISALREQCDSNLVKPIDIPKSSEYLIKSETIRL